MSEIQPFTAAAPAPSRPPLPADQIQTVPDNETDPIETFLANGRLQINANVGLKGIGRLKEMLGKYEELLKLMDPDAKGK